MRITTLLILVISLHLSAKTTAQKITLSSNNISIEQFFNQLEKQTGFSFLLENGVVSKDEKISVDVKDVSLEIVLDQILKPINLSYKIENKTVYILKSQPLSSGGGVLPVSVPPIDIHGRVTDSLGNPLAGVSVTVKGGKAGTSTDGNGNFILYGVNVNATLVISNVGYADQLIKVKGRSTIAISLKAQSTSLAEVVVNKGYYSTTQILNTGNVSIVSAVDIEKQPVTDPILALDGRVPGLYIQQSIGLPGSNSVVRIRGQNSIFNGNNPLYIVDGVPYSSVSPSNPNIAGGVLANPSVDGLGLSPFNDLDPSSIESIEILKDADATAIYGSRGANGVILITTKKGKAGKTQVSVNAFSGIENVSHFVDLMNTTKYLSMIHEGITNSGLDSYLTPEYSLYFPDLLVWDTTRYTNWQKVLIGNAAKFNNISATVSGGNANTQFRVNVGYSNQGTVYPGSFSDQKAMFSTSLTHASSDQRFHLQLSINYVYEFNNLPQTDFTSMATSLAPDAPPLYDANGNLNWAPYSGTATWVNPLASEYTNAQSRIDNLVGNLTLNYEILPDFNAKLSAGYTHMQNNEQHEILSTATAPPDNTLPDFRSNGFGTNDFKTWILEPQLSYEKNIGRGKLNLLIGSTFQQNLSNNSGFRASGFSNDYLVSDPSAASTIQLTGYTNTVYHYDAGYARLGYNWDNKYVLNLTGRRDGSSRFGPGKQFGNFYAIGAAWIFSNEDFIRNNLAFLSLGKLRMSYGTTGNDQIGDYQYLSTYTPTGGSYQNVSSLVPLGHTNPDFAWEQVQKLEGGIELGFLKDRINLGASYYVNRTQNSLVGYSLPVLTGFPTVEANLPAKVQNSGFELVVNTINIRTEKFSWSTSINFTASQNKLVAFPNLANTPYINYMAVGQSLAIRKLFHYEGIDPATGTAQFATSNGLSGNPSTPQDLQVTEPVTQRWYGGIENSFSYKAFSLSFLFQFVNQIGFNYLLTSPLGYLAGNLNQNEPIQLLNHWQKPGDVAAYGIYSQSNLADPFNALPNSDWGLVNSSFIRLKNVALSYNLPKTWMKKISIQNCRIYLQGQNLFTFTHNYVGYDPETGGAALPLLRIITAGLQVTF